MSLPAKKKNIQIKEKDKPIVTITLKKFRNNQRYITLININNCVLTMPSSNRPYNEHRSTNKPLPKPPQET